jgi:HPt (histidine-containing phosphotransfer) domain-containing protein
MDVDEFKTIFLSKPEKAELFVTRKEEVQDALSVVEFLLESWLDVGLEQKRTGKSTYDLRAQYMMPELNELKRKNDMLNKLGERDPRETWIKQNKLMTKIEELKDKIELEKSIPYIDSIDGVVIKILDYNLVSAEDSTREVNTAEIRVTVEAILPNEFLDEAKKGEGGMLMYAKIQEAGADAVAPFRTEAGAKVAALSEKLRLTFEARTAEEVTAEERNQLVEEMGTLNRKLHAMAQEAGSAASAAISKFIHELKDKQPEARSNWIFRFVKKLILGIASLGVSIARIVVSSGSDIFAYVGGAKAVIAISSELYDAFKSAQLVHKQLKKNIKALQDQLRPKTAMLEPQSVASAKEASVKLLGMLGVTPSFCSTFVTTCGGTADNLTLFRSKLRAINIKCGDMLMKVNTLLKVVKELDEEEREKIPKMESVINKLLNRIFDLQASTRGYTLESIEADVILKNYREAYNSLIPMTKEEENFCVGDVLSVLGFANNIDSMLAGPMTTIIVDPIKDAVKEAVAAA